MWRAESTTYTEAKSMSGDIEHNTTLDPLGPVGSLPDYPQFPSNLTRQPDKKLLALRSPYLHNGEPFNQYVWFYEGKII